MGKSHQNIAGQMKTELEEPLAAFAGAMKERRKIVQGGIEKLLKVKVQQTQHCNKVGKGLPGLHKLLLTSQTGQRQIRAGVFEDKGILGARPYGNGTRREKEQGEVGKDQN